MALKTEHEAYLRLAAHSLENSKQIAHNLNNLTSPKAYGGYVPPAANQHNTYDQSRGVYLNGYPGNGLSPSSPPSNANQTTLSDTNLYIKNLPPEYSDKDLAALVEGCGKIKSMKAIIDKQTNKCKGFGFIDFESHEDARLAINELQKKGYTAQLAKSSQQQEQDETNLYFANLDPNMTEQDLRQALSEFGTVISVRILRDQNKQSRGVGFARMNDRGLCQEIINQFHNKSFEKFSDKIVQVKFADASKNKKLYKGGFDNGQPPYAPLDQAGPYTAPPVLYHNWPSLAPPPVPVHNQPGAPLHPTGHHPMYSQPTPMRPSIPGFNHMSPYLATAPEPGPAYVLPVPVQQLQQLHIANGHPGTFCIMNPGHPGFFMTSPQTAAPGQVPVQHDS